MAEVNFFSLAEGIDLTYMVLTGPEFGEWGGSPRVAGWEVKGAGGWCNLTFFGCLLEVGEGQRTHHYP